MQDPPLDFEARREARRWLGLLGVLSAGSLCGVAFSLYLVNHFPLLLIGHSPLGRHLVLVAPTVDPTAFVAVAVGRRMIFYFACYRVGRALGPAGIGWIEARAARFGRFVRFIERLFSRASHTVVLLMTGPTVSALAGISGMRASVYLGLAGVGLVARVLIVLFFAEALREPIEAVLAWIDRYWLPGTVLIIAAIVVQRWHSRRRLFPEADRQEA